MLFFETTTEIMDVINTPLCGLVNIYTIKKHLPFLSTSVSVQKSKKTLLSQEVYL